MKLASPDEGVLEAALAGDLKAIDSLLRALQSGVFNLAIRMLGNRQDAADATQEILLKVITHLGSFRRDSSLSTWVFRIARNHLLTSLTRAKEHPEISLEAMQEKLALGLKFGERFHADQASQRILTNTWSKYGALSWGSFKPWRDT
jgi:RNA polymerase sigma factor (sigma-70 family)